MKKLTMLILTVVCAVLMTACGRDMNYIISHEPSLEGIVSEVHDNSVLMTADDGGEYVVSLNVENSDSATHFSVGDGIIVYYDGNVAETAPMQINKVYAILLTDPANREKSLSDHGLDVISLMAEMAKNESYLSSYGADFSELASSASVGDYSAPKAVYEIEISDAYMFMVYESVSFEGFSEELAGQMKSRAISAVSTQINALAGGETLAVSSICTAEKTFVFEEAIGDILYLYVFEKGAPVMVHFSAGEDMSVSASGCFIFNSDFPTNSQEEIADYLSDYVSEVRLIN